MDDGQTEWTWVTGDPLGWTTCPEDGHPTRPNLQQLCWSRPMCYHYATPTNRAVGKYTCVSKTVPPLTCYNLDIHGSITIIFGKCYRESRQSIRTVLYFLTSPNLCYCTTWGSRKPENCIFSLKWCMLFSKNTQNALKYHLVTAEPSFTVKTIDGMQQIGPSILLSVTHMLCVNQVSHSVGRCVKDGSYSSSSLSESRWTVSMGYLTISSSANVDAIKHITDDNFSFSKIAHWCIVHAIQSNCCSALD